MTDIAIYIDGMDGTGKTSLVNMLRQNGFTNVYDRSILTKYSMIHIKDLPENIPSSDSIKKQLLTLKNNFVLSTNRSYMTRLITDSTTRNDANDKSVYIILSGNVSVCHSRLLGRQTQFSSKNGTNLDEWDSYKSLRYFHNKYLYLAYKYDVPIIDTTNLTKNEVYDLAMSIINDVDVCDPNDFIFVPNMKFTPTDLFLLELEWIISGESSVIYIDEYCAITRKSNDNADNRLSILSQNVFRNRIDKFNQTTKYAI